jgi:hypothetical protein
MSYSEIYPLYIKSAEYCDLDVDSDEMMVIVTFADGSVNSFFKEEEIAEIGIQLAAQVAALNAGETISYRA